MNLKGKNLTPSGKIVLILIYEGEKTNQCWDRDPMIGIEILHIVYNSFSMIILGEFDRKSRSGWSLITTACQHEFVVKKC